MTMFRMMSDIVGFLSYVREDDATEDGRITELRRRLEAEVRIQTGEVFSIFQDRDDIFVGQRWRQRIESSIDESSLLIAIVTPSFLRSDSCRQEVQLFIERERQLCRDDLIVPILYVHTPGLSDTGDEVARNLLSRQYFDWTPLRFEDLESSVVRSEIARLGQQVVVAIDRSRQSTQEPIVPETSLSEDGPGVLELLAEAEDALPDFITTLESLTQTTNTVGEMTREAADEIDAISASGRPASVRLAIIHRLSRRLDEPAQGMELLAREYLDQLRRVDGGMTLLIEQIDSFDSDGIEAAEGLSHSVDAMREASEQALDSLEGYQRSLVGAYSISSTLRPVLRRIHSALGVILSSRGTFRSWSENLATALDRRRQQLSE